MKKEVKRKCKNKSRKRHSGQEKTGIQEKESKEKQKPDMRCRTNRTEKLEFDMTRLREYIALQDSFV